MRISTHWSKQEDGSEYVRRVGSVDLIYRDINTENRILLQLIPRGCIMETGSGYDDTIGCAEVVSVSILCSRCSNLAVSSLYSYVL